MEGKVLDVPLFIACYVILATALGLVGSCDIMSAAKCTDNMTIGLTNAENNPDDVAGKLCTIRLGDIESCLNTHLLGCSKDSATNVDTMKIRFEKMKANLTHICNSVNGCDNMVQRSLDLTQCFSIDVTDKDQSCSAMSTLLKCVDKFMGDCDLLKKNFIDNIQKVNDQAKKMGCGGSSKTLHSLLWTTMAIVVTISVTI
ncbi:uncharacterized protein LOC135489749 isoform X2 [Lineus longissimus]|uniref:uncharacterized protein LOC135489749 isoform X2 n=1 Tax=Lineus longissimus TaxID=88925 RepID=UPI002B4C540D